MIVQPFSLLAPFEDELSLVLLTKEDNVHCDADIARAIGTQSIVGLKQMHGKNIVNVGEPSSRALEADGLITKTPKLTLTARFADCQGLVVYAPQQKILGLLHVGWRGLVAGAIPSFFQSLNDDWKVHPHDTIVGIGPSLCINCAEFTDPHAEVPSLSAYIRDRHVDLVAAADDQLAAAGVQPHNMERIADCTCCNSEKYWTYRGGDREKVKEGYVNCFAATLLR